jgi:hypothetical protein
VKGCQLHLDKPEHSADLTILLPVDSCQKNFMGVKKHCATDEVLAESRTIPHYNYVELITHIPVSSGVALTMYIHMKKKPNSKIIYSPDSYMVTPAEYIQIIAAGIYGAALFFTILTFQRSKRLDQISLATEVMHELRDLDRELAKIPSESQNDDVKRGVYSRMLNTIDWLSFLVNEKMVTDKRLVARMKPIVVRYYEDLVQNNVRRDEKKVIAYEDLEKLYRKIKK